MILQEPKRFAIDLLEFLNGQAQYLYSLMSMTAAGVAQQSIGVTNGGGIGTRAVNSESSSPTPADRLKLSDMALEALANVMKHNKGSYIFNRTITVSSTSKKCELMF